MVENGDLDPETADALDVHGVRRVTYRGRVNLSAKMNLGARHAAGDYLLFMNDDLEVISPDWVERAAGVQLQPGVGRGRGQALLPGRPAAARRRLGAGGEPGPPLLPGPGRLRRLLRQHAAGAARLPGRDRRLLPDAAGGLRANRRLRPAIPVQLQRRGLLPAGPRGRLPRGLTPHAELYHYDSRRPRGGPRPAARRAGASARSGSGESRATRTTTKTCPRGSGTSG